MKNKNCFDCGVKLTERNTSIWSMFVENKGDKVSASFCLKCSEMRSRQLSSCKREGNDLIPQKTKEEIFKEMEGEGITEDVLRKRQEDFLQEEAGDGL